MLRPSEIAESFRIATSALRVNLMRSILTMGGVVVGIVLVVVMGWTIKGLDAVWERTIGIIGRDMLYMDKWNWAGGGNWRDAEARKDITERQAWLLAERMESAEYVMPLARSWNGSVTLGNKQIMCSVQGTTQSYGNTPAGTTEQGRWFTGSEALQGSHVVVLGHGVNRTLFPDNDGVGKTIKIGGIPYTVIGVVEKRGFIFMDFIDNQVFISLNAFKSTFGFFGRSFSIAIKAGNEKLLDIVRDEARGYLREIRNVPPGKDDDFSINEMQAFDAQVTTIRIVIWMVGIGLTVLAFIVGSIGIMNIMFVSVTERTKEIGIRKAIGARRSSVLLQFLIESSMICLLGALIALPIAQILVGSARWVAIGPLKQEWVSAVSPFIQVDLLFIAIAVSVVVGLLAGFLPALRASRLDPVECLRFE
ncbi:MAG: ABC transporter permease [Bradyrhizobiaceae bacterium]|nr:ABC transporter permease [Bradyrhizobiaceae bacterium]